jgi:hypothetical protein
MKKRINIVSILLMILFFSCKESQENVQSIRADFYYNNFDISLDDSTIFLAITEQGNSSIYKANLGNGKLIPFLKSHEDTSYLNPKLSPDGKQIMCIGYKSGELTSFIVKVNTENNMKRTFIPIGKLAIEGVFSKYNDELYLAIAGSFDRYSPFWQMDPHEYNIYTLNLNTTQIQKLTDTLVYGMSELVEIDSTSLMARIDAGPNSGFYYIKKHSNKMKRFSPQIPGVLDNFLYNITYSKIDKRIIFSGVYEIYSLSQEGKYETIVKTHAQPDGSGTINDMALFKTKNSLLVNMNNSENIPTFYVVDIGTREMKELNFHFN